MLIIILLYLSVKSFNPHFLKYSETLTCKIGIARHLVVNFSLSSSANFGLSRANPGGALNYELGELCIPCCGWASWKNNVD